MRITKRKSTTKGINTFSLLAVSLLWGVMLGLISPWWMIAQVFTTIVAFGTEISDDQ